MKGFSMAEAGRSVSELDNGNSVLCTDPLLPHSKSSTDGGTHPLRQEELRRSSSELTSPCCHRDPKINHPGPTQAAQNPDRPHTPDCVDRPRTPDRVDRPRTPERVDRPRTPDRVDRPRTPDRVDRPRTPDRVDRPHTPDRVDRPPSMAELSHTAHQREEAITNQSEAAQPSSSERDLIGLDLPRLPVHRSHSDTLHMYRKAHAPPPHSETACPSYPGRDYLLQKAIPTSARGEPMLLQNCSPVNTMCTQPPQAGCVCVRAPGSTNTLSEVSREAKNPHSRQDGYKCYCSFAHPHGILEDTFAAYCHPQPIPAPAQLASRLLGAQAEYRDQRALPPHAAPTLLSLPRLMSSVSETGLDAKRLLQCCDLSCSINCSWANTLPPGVALQKYMQENSCTGGTNRVTRDTGTMTTGMELREVGVQTGQVEEALPAHVFPQVCLAEENGSDDGNGTDDRSESATETDTSQKPPVKEVKWDAEGMTWEVYGASVDPEELGLAIQKHLELQIKETACRVAKLSRENTTTPRTTPRTTPTPRKGSAEADGKRRRGKVMGSFRTPSCCVLSGTAVD